MSRVPSYEECSVTCPEPEQDIQCGADVALGEQSIVIVLHAITGGDVRQVKQWVNSGVLYVNRNISYGLNALHVAAWFHQMEVMKAMIQAGWDVDSQSDCGGRTALHYVMHGVYDGRYDRPKSAVFTLLNAGCNPNICDISGWTALHWVVYVSNGRDCSQEKIQVIIEVIQMLIDAGADITIKDEAGKTALDLSKRETVSNLLKKKLAEVAQASCRQQLKKQAAEATQAYVKSLPDPPDSVEVLLKLTQEQCNIKPDIELVQARAEEDERIKEFRQRMEDEKYLPCYRMDRKPRGVCVIINNEKFIGCEGRDKLPDRDGTDIDAARLTTTFEKLHFKVESYKDRTAEQMIKILIDLASAEDHSQFDCFVCCVLSHGELGKVFGVDGEPVEIAMMTGYFRALSSPTLKGKPKLFFLQACQGKMRQQIVDIQTDDPTDERHTIPNEADFLFGYATVPGFVSYRSRSQGSWYITKLTEHLDKDSKRYDLLSILTNVNSDIASSRASLEGSTYGQVPAPQHTLRKRVFFNE